MKGVNTTAALCLLSGLGTQVSAANPAEIRLELSQLSSAGCLAAASQTNRLVPGDCLVYRMTVENVGGHAAHHVRVSALIPEHTELHSEIRDVSQQRPLTTFVERKTDGTRLVNTILPSVPAGDNSKVVLEYVVKVR